MKKRNFVIIATLVMLLTSVFLTGCNTWKGMGKDVERTGEKMQ